MQARVSAQELAAWRAKAAAAGVSSSTLLRQAMTHTGVWALSAADMEGRRAQHRVDRELIRQIARIGVNCNQLARWANHHKAAGDARKVLERLAAIERALRDLAPSG